MFGKLCDSTPQCSKLFLNKHPHTLLSQIFDAHDALANVRRLEVEEMVKVPFATEWTGQAR